MDEKIRRIEERFEEVTALLTDAEVLADPARQRTLAKERRGLEEIVRVAHERRRIQSRLEGDQEILQRESDPEFLRLAREETAELTPRLRALEERLTTLLVPRDPQESKDTIVEIRAGTGGEEAALFAKDLFRMYTRYTEGKGWRVELLEAHPTERGGLREAIFLVQGESAYGTLRYESGVHRVQRVPVTEAGGRIHTSAATVAVLPEADEVEVTLDEKDLRINVFRSSGPGGQSVNTTDSAVRITHLPTGIVVTCQDEKSQLKNKTKALRVLRARLLDRRLAEQEAERARARRLQVGTGDRSAKIRTYNFPQGRVTDHRIGLTLHKLDAILDGELDGLTEALRQADQAERLAAT